METAALVSSIVSIIIGGFAIWLSVTFYRMSNKISEDTKEAAKGISASVNRLESLFDSLYSDTFSMMKDTVTDMRKHIWPEKEQPSEALKQIEQKAEAKIVELRKQISDDLSDVMGHLGRADRKIDDVEVRLTKVVDRAIQQTRKVESEAQEEKFMSEITSAILNFVGRSETTRVVNILKALIKYYPTEMILTALQHTVEDKQLFADGDIHVISTRVSISPP